ncbi:putative serine/threonine-protein kinase, partial [Tetrabaena socialis]
ASDTRSLFALLQQPGVQSIRLSGDIVIRAEELPAQRPILLDRNVTISGGQDVGAPLPDLSSTLPNMTMLDFAFLPVLIRLAPGVVLRFECIEVWRATYRSFTYLTFLARSPGAEVQFVRSIQHRLACLPPPARMTNLLSLPGQPPNRSQQAGEVMSPPLCWRTAGGAGGAAARRPTDVAGGVPEASVPAGATCRSPFLQLLNVSYLALLLDTDLENNGGYVVTYLDSLFACDWPVSDACIAQEGAARCQSEMTSEHEREYDDVPPPDAAAGGPPRLALALGVGLGGGALVLCGILAAAALLVRRRRHSRGRRGTDSSNEEVLAVAVVGGQAGDEEGRLGGPMVVVGCTAADKSTPSNTVSNAGAPGSSTGASQGRGAAAPHAGEAGEPRLPSRPSAADLSLADSGQVEAVRRQLAAGGQVAAVQVLEPIGAGSFARVYRGLWQGRVVALKVMVLPSGIRQQQAQMEAAVSASMNHPSIVQTYSYSFRMVLDSTSSWSRQRSRLGSATDALPPPAAPATVAISSVGSSSATPGGDQPHGYELQLVLEYCDLGSLRGALDLGAFHRRGAAAEATGRGGAGEDGREENAGGGGAGECGGGDGKAGAGWLAAQVPAFRYGLMLAVAYDVASALLHLHTHGIVHGDVKACNVLLTSGSGGRSVGIPAPGAATLRGNMGAATCRGNRRSDPPTQSSDGGSPGRAWSREEVQQRLMAGPVLAKLADFGLATYVDEREGTHVSATSAQASRGGAGEGRDGTWEGGTLSHVAPELLLHGHISRHVDTYAFGILLHELFTGGRAYSGVPKALLPHQVAVQGLRPVLPPYTPPAFRLLVESCWDANPHSRPSIQGVMAALQSMRAAQGAAAAEAAAAAADSDSGPAVAGEWVAVPPGFEVFGGARGGAAEFHAPVRSSQFSLYA